MWQKKKKKAYKTKQQNKDITPSLQFPRLVFFVSTEKHTWKTLPGVCYLVLLELTIS